MKSTVGIMIAALSTCGCATMRAEPPTSPDFSEIPTDAAPASARFYADCFEQAIASNAYRRADDGGGDELLLFTCTGAPARAFFDALGPWSASHQSEFMMGDRLARSTARVQRNLYGADYCSARNGQDHRCVISFNAGDFIRTD